MEQNTPQRKRPRVTRKQLQRRRIGALVVLLVVIFLLSTGCSSCIRCACKTDAPSVSPSAPAAVTGTTAPTEASTQLTTEAVTLPDEYLVDTMPESYQIPVEYVSQYPELPTGNEVTSLTMVLNYLGYDVRKETLANNFLTCAETGTATFSQAYIGSPFDNYGMGCFAPVIVDTAQKYLKAQGSGRYVKALNADNFDDLLHRVASNYPILVWVSQGLEPVNEEYCFTIYGDAAAQTTAPVVGTAVPIGEEVPTTAPAEATEAASKQDVYWISNATCVVLTGYDLENNTVTVIDPSQGEITYDMGLFKTSYNALYKQAVIIY